MPKPKLKKWKEVMEVLRRAGFRPRRDVPSKDFPFEEKIVGSRRYVIKGREVLIWVCYRFDNEKKKEVFEAVVPGTDICEVVEDVTPEAILKAIKDAKRAVSKAFARIDAVAKSEPLGKEEFFVWYESGNRKVSLVAEAVDSGSVGRLELTVNPLISYNSIEVKLPTHDVRKALRIMRKIVKIVKDAGYQLRKPWYCTPSSSS